MPNLKCNFKNSAGPTNMTQVRRSYVKAVGTVSIHLQELFLVVMVAVGHVHGHQKRRRRHKDQLEAPETDVGDRKELIVADILTARLKEHTQAYRMSHLKMDRGCFALQAGRRQTLI